MLTVHKFNAAFLPELNENGLIDSPIQEDLLLDPYEVRIIHLQYGIDISGPVVIDIFVCGEMRRANVSITEGRTFHTSTHKKLTPLSISITNKSNNSIEIKSGHHLFHGLVISHNTNITYEN